MSKNNYKKNLPKRVQALITKRQMEKLFCSIQGFLMEVDSYPKDDLLVIDNLTQMIGRRINVVRTEVKGRVECA